MFPLSVPAQALVQSLAQCGKLLSEHTNTPCRGLPTGLQRVEDFAKLFIRGLEQRGASGGWNFTPTILG